MVLRYTRQAKSPLRVSADSSNFTNKFKTFKSPPPSRPFSFSSAFMEGEANCISSVFSWSIESFSTLIAKKYSVTFQACGHTWQLLIYPMGHGVDVDKLSLYLCVADSDIQPLGWTINCKADLAVIDQVSARSTLQREFLHEFRSSGDRSWGYSAFMSLSELNDSNKGFLVNDTLIIKACVTIAQKSITSSTFTWAIKNFSGLSERLYSNSFMIGSYQWKVAIFPRRSGHNTNKLEVILHVADSAKLPRGWSRYTRYDLSVIDQVSSHNTVREEFQHRFNATTSNWGYPSFAKLTNLHDSTKGFLVDDTLVVQACVSDAQEDPISSIFTWTIEKFSTLKNDMYSTTFLAGGYEWRLQIYPKGDSDVDKLGLYLYVADLDNQPLGWSRYAQYEFSVVDQVSGQYTVQRELEYKFNAQSSKWGYPSFMPLIDLYDPTRGFLVNDSLIVKVGVSAGKVVEYHSYNSKKETGHVGLKNHGSTSYINSLLQSLYHIPYFRKVVYRMPGTENDMSSRSITLALQCLFYELQYSKYSVSTKDLTESLGWDINGVQHDVQELNLVLREKLEEKLKDTNLEGGIQELFMGHQTNYIECVNVDYRASREESFYDLQLDVQGCRDVYASLDKFVGIECLDGDNKYNTEHHGLQDAKKGVLFVDFPPVLQLQLKRFDYDFRRAAMVKIYDRYEFPLELDLDRENGKYLSPNADWKIRNLYTLHSVLVHNGGDHRGRYHVFIRPTLSDQWFNFDDERVTKEVVECALEGQYGGEEEPELDLGPKETPIKIPKLTNACALVYIRKSEMERIMSDVNKHEVAEHLQLRLKKEQDEKERKKKEGQIYTTVKVAQNKDVLAHLGRDKYFDLVDQDKVRRFHINNWMRFRTFKEEVAKEFGIPVQFQRFWLWEKRENNTDRPSRHLTPAEETQSIGQLREFSNEAYNVELKLLLEVELDQDSHPIQLPEKTEDDILLFFKLYDPIKEELRTVGRIFVKRHGFPSEILSKLNQMAGFSPIQEVELYKEVRFEPNVVCESIDMRLTIGSNQLADGDIIYFQRPLAGQQCLYPNVPLFMEFLHNRKVVRFRSLEKPGEEDFSLELSKISIHNVVVERVACVLEVHDPTRIRITSHDPLSKKPQPTPIEPSGTCYLSEMLFNSNQTCDILYYEVLNPKAEAGTSSAAVQASRSPSCVICLDAPLEGACIPCGHMAGCMSCLNEIKDKNMGCPVCRKKIQTVIRIYSA